MPCGCTDKKLNDNESLNKDKLSLDAMKGLSIDEIISLYKQGYVLESTEFVESMTYGTDCTGSVAVDRQLASTGSLATITMTDAAAQRFVPTSRCLKSVTLKLSRVLDNDAYVEIRADSGGSGALPVGNPQDTSNRIASATIPYASIPVFPTFGEVTVPLDILLPNLNPLWIVTCLYAYVSPCNTYPSPCGDASYHVDGGGTGTGTVTEYGARKADVNPWTKFGSLYFKTNRQTYGPPAPVLTSISVTPTSASVNVGTPQQLTAVCIDQYSNTMTCPTLTWVSSDPTKATVSSSGLVSGIVAGSTNITASAGGVTSNISAITVSVPSQVLGSIIVSPASQSINTGGIVQLTAACKDTSNATMTCPTLTWVSSDPTKATVSSSGLVNGLVAGSTNITASVGAVISDPSAITVNVPSQVLGSIIVSPASQSINTGGIVQLTAVCKDLSNATMTCPTLTWVSSDPTKATVSSSGLVNGIVAGSANITASVGAVISDPSAITVTGTVSTLTSIVVSPASASIVIGGTRQLTAVCKDQNVNAMACPTLTWASSNNTKATVSSSGLVTGVAEGTANVTASVGIIASNASIITVTTTPPVEAGSGGAMMIAAVAAIGIAYFMMRKPPTKP